MTGNQKYTLQEWVERVNHKVFVLCTGENNYPNASIRKVDVLSSGDIVFAEDMSGRTAKFLKESPNVLLLFITKEESLKAKGTVKFSNADEKLDISKQAIEGGGKDLSSISTATVTISDIFPM